LKIDLIAMVPSHDPKNGVGGLDRLVENNDFLKSIPHPINFLERTKFVDERHKTKD
jgi:hypothetical protein